MTQIKGVFNGSFDIVDNIKVSPFSRAYTFSDSVYEVVPFFNSKPIAFEAHLKRLEFSSSELSISLNLEKISNDLNCVVVSVEYRLAPTNPYPAAPDACETAAVWLIENSKKEFNTEKIVIGGESAGANLSAVILLRLKSKGLLDTIKGANLIYGSYDCLLYTSPSPRDRG
mgnify:CR=1 FL=1